MRQQIAKRKRPIIMASNPHSPISESYRTLRTNIEFSQVDEELKVIMISSASPGEGKSTTAVNLAAAYANAGNKVLLIDADLRKPTIHYTFNLTNRVGLTCLLTGQNISEETARPTHIEGLSVITSGPTPPNPSELLASRKMRMLMEEWKRQYDVILLDTPPILAVTDAQIVAHLTDGTVMVLHSGKIKRDMVRKAKASLEHVNAKILGVVLNNVKREGAAGYYYNYYGKAQA